MLVRTIQLCIARPDYSSGVRGQRTIVGELSVEVDTTTALVSTTGILWSDDIRITGLHPEGVTASGG